MAIEEIPTFGKFIKTRNMNTTVCYINGKSKSRPKIVYKWKGPNLKLEQYKEQILSPIGYYDRMVVRLS